MVDSDADVRETVTTWWEQRRTIDSDGPVWEIPFPLVHGNTGRVTLQQCPEGAVWRASLVRQGALTAYLEVESSEGPIPLLENLYRHGLSHGRT